MSESMEGNLSEEPDINTWKQTNLMFSMSRLSGLLNLFRSNPMTTRPPTTSFAPGSDPIRKALFSELLQHMSCCDADSIIASPSLRWYQIYLERKLNTIDSRLLRVIVKSEQHPAAAYDSIAIVALLSQIVNLIKSINHISIEGIATELHKRGMLVFSKGESPLALQLIFILIGLLTFFYEPSLSPKEGTFQVELSLARLERKKKSSKRFTWASELSIEKGAALSIADLLRNFCAGELPLSRMRINGSTVPASMDALATPNLNYYTLVTVAGLEIVWVDSVFLHLDFDRKKKILRLFRLPSFCALLCQDDPDKTYLDRFFKTIFENANSDDFESYNNMDIFTSGDYFQELIASYRVIFGQSEDSRNMFNCKYGRKWNVKQLQVGWDPLLPRLCAYDWTQEQVYDDLDTSNVKTVYSAQVDFPFFGQKLVTLQEYVLTQVPNNMLSLWRDRRDVSRFWTLWAIMVFGGIGVFLGILQVSLAAAQVWGAFEMLR